MPQKRGKNAPDSSEAEEKIVIDRWDAAALRNALDDSAKKYLTSRSVNEDFHYTDIRLGLAITACLCSVLALTVDYFFPYPKSHHFLIVCVAMYFVLMTAQTAFVILFQKNFFFFGVTDSKVSSHKWRLSSDLRRFENLYNLELQFEDTKQPPARTATMSIPFSPLFDERGEFNESGFHAEMKSLVEKVSPKSKKQ